MRYAIKKPLWPYVLDVQSPQAQGLVGWWPGDPSGGKLFDLSLLGKGNHGSLSGNVKSGGGNDGGSSLLFTGGNVSTFSRNISPVGSRSIFAWIMPTSTSRIGICGNRPSVGSFGWAFTANLTTAGNLSYYHAGVGSTITFAAGLSSNSWYHVGATYDGVTATLFRNGISIGSGALAPENASSFTGVFGDEDGSFGTPFSGPLEDIKIYNRVLSKAEAWSLFDPSTRWSQRYRTEKTKYYVGLNPLITFDSAGNSGYTAATSSFSGSASWSGSNRMLSVDVSMLGPGVTVTAMTYGGANCTFIGGQSTVTSFGRVESWRIIQADSGAPASGSNTLSVTLSGSVAFAINWVAYTGVHQTSPIEAFNSAQATNVGASDATVSITTVAVNDWVHGAVATDDASVTANQTTRNNVTGAGGSGADEDTGPIASPGATTISYTNVGALATWAIAGYAIRPTTAASLGGGPFPYFRRANELTGGFFGMGL